MRSPFGDRTDRSTIKAIGKPRQVIYKIQHCRVFPRNHLRSLSGKIITS